MDFEIPSATSSLEVMMGGASVIQVEMDSVPVDQQYHRDQDNENNNMMIDGVGEEVLTSKQDGDEPPPSVPEQVAAPTEAETMMDSAPVAAQEDLQSENDTTVKTTATPTPAAAAPPPPTGLQIVTRKRSSMSAPSQGNVIGAAALPPLPQGDVKAEPAKKKKKCTPKPKAIPPPPAPKPNPPPRTKKAAPSKSKKQPAPPPPGKKGTKTPSPPALTQENSDEQPQLLPPPLKLQLPKLTKIPQLQLQMHQNLHQNQQEPQPPTLEVEMSTGNPSSASSEIPLSLVKEEPLDYEANEECCEPGIDNILEPSAMETEHEDGEQGRGEGGDLATTITVATNGCSGKPSRKKKSKGRNGNIYIGVFNRIEWMKLQEEYGFQSVNNFGTFVLQTMRKLHGDISFWCNLAKASGVYPELEKYVWRNGFPHAVNNDGEAYSPPEVDLTEEKREEVVELAKSMWDQRITELRQQAQQEEQQQAAEGNVGSGSGEVITTPEEGEDDEEGEEEEKEDPGLENYLENMASGKYSVEIGLGGGKGAKAAAVSPGGDAEVESGGGEAGASGQEGKPGLLSEEQVNTIWNEQVSNVQSLEEYGKVFSLINSIHHQENLEVVVGKESEEGVEEETNQ
ncbi:unnamed protein product [Orchesella dallaii]|uniref:Uncharacterized protein n=1 Tax=Orchesella dallaii TaxID=48710 RepID=A0ABP1S6U7_9HEXA